MSRIRFFVFALVCFAAPAAHAVCYVNGSAVGSRNDGSSWENAYSNLQWALINPACTEVWVAKGVYKPTTAVDPSISFSIGSGVKVYGGFGGGETTVDQRLPSTNLTILSGDIDSNDVYPNHNYIVEYSSYVKGENSYHVVLMDGSVTPISNSTVLDGFTITGGHASSSAEVGSGGGLYCDGRGIGQRCNPILANLTFIGNLAIRGGAVGNDGSAAGESSPTIINTIFRNNHAEGDSSKGIDGDGGALLDDAEYGTSSPILKNDEFDGNFARTGGAISGDAYYGISNLNLTNVIFFENNAYRGGAIRNFGTEGLSTLSSMNVTFIGNIGQGSGGAVYNGGFEGECFTVFVNSIFWGNASPHGRDIFDYAAKTEVDYSILQDDCAFFQCSHTIVSDPLLKLLPLTSIIGMYLELPDVGSPAINSGTNTGCPVQDIRGVPRPQNSTCDMGSVEWQLLDDVIFKNGFEIH